MFIYFAEITQNIEKTQENNNASECFAELYRNYWKKTLFFSFSWDILLILAYEMTA